MAKKRDRKVKAGEGKYDAGERALSGKKAPEEDRTKVWTNADQDPNCAYLLPDWHTEMLQKSSKGNAESRALLQLHHQIPSSYPEISVGHVMGWDELKKLGRNIMARVLDMSKNRVMKPASIQVSTIDGDHKQDIAARQATKALKGLNSDNDTQALETRLFYDSSLTHRGKGCSMWFPDGSGNLKDWRLDPLETWISKNGKRAVTKLYVDREDAIAMVMLFAEDGKKEEIEALVRNADADHPEPITGVDFEEEMDLEDEVGLYFGFIEQRGGRKPWMIIAIDSETVLYSGEMPIKTQPISWMNCTAGYREGQSKPEGRGIAPYSYWLNQLQQKLYTSLQYSVPHVVAEEGQDVKPPMDAPFHVWRFAKGKNPVTVEIPKTVSADVIANMKDLQENAMQDKGLTEDTAAGAVPHGVVSGVAIGKIQNEMAIAFSEQIHNVNAYRIRSARIACYWLSSDHMKDAKIRAKATNSEDMEAISWPSLGMEENTWTVVIQTAGALPESPGGKAQMISVFQEMGLVDERDAAMAFDNPDLMKLLSRKTTPLRLIRLQISMCLEMDPPRIYAPDETQDPVLGYEETAAAYADARIKGKKKYPRAQTDALFRLHILYRNRMKNTAPAATVSAPAPTLAGGGTNTGTAGAAAGLSAGAGSMLTDPAAQAASATTGASGTL